MPNSPWFPILMNNLSDRLSPAGGLRINNLSIRLSPADGLRAGTCRMANWAAPWLSHDLIAGPGVP